MSGYLSYELQTFLGGTWKTDSVFDDREIATFEAQRVQKSGRYSAVRLVEDRYDQKSGNYVSKTVFRATKADSPNIEATDRLRKARIEKDQLRQAERKIVRDDEEFEEGDDDFADAAAYSGPGPVALTIRFGAIALSGIGVIIALHYFFAQI